MWLAPSDVHFLIGGSCLQPDERLLAVTSTSCTRPADLPKMQVTEKNGTWFALNNSCLHLLRRLQKQGKCQRVFVDVVPLSKVPASVQKCMLVADGGHHQHEQDEEEEEAGDGTAQDSGRVTKRGYHKLSDASGEVSANSTPLHLVAALPSESEGGSSFSETDNSSDFEKDEDSDYDESLTCNVCERSFPSTRHLAQHQQRKRHYGCSVCDSIFPSLMTLEEHKEALEHWSAEEGLGRESESDSDMDPLARSAELERLL